MNILLRQTVTVSLLNVATLRTRAGSSAFVVTGIAGVVFVLTALFAMANGLRETLQSSGEADRVLLLGKGSRSEINGSISRDQAAIIAGLPGIAISTSPGTTPSLLLSAELYATANLPRRDQQGRAGLPLRGVGAAAFGVRPEVRIAKGRSLLPGRFELIVGESAARLFAGLQTGDTISLKGVDFEVVGHFSAAGRATESEAWMDVNVMANVFKRSAWLNTIRLRLETPESLGILTAAIMSDRRLTNSIFRESDFYNEQSESSTRLMTIVGVTVGIIMALGAVATALNSLYSAVSARMREIAILRAIGFSAAPVVVSVLVESLALSLIGGMLGAALGWLVFDGLRMTSVGAAYSQVAFRFAVEPTLVLSGVLLALLIGFFGGLLPAVRAARTSVVDALRSVA